MTTEDLAVKVADVDSRARSNTRRIDKLEQSNEALNRLATSVEVIATKQEQMAESVERLDGKVSDLEAKPGRRWDSIVEKIIWAIVAAFLGFLLAKFGLS